MPATHKVDTKTIYVHKDYDATGRSTDAPYGVRPRYHEETILVVGRRNVAGFAIGYIPPGYAAIQETGGPFVPGPWSYAAANPAVINNSGGTAAELALARAGGRLLDALPGDRLDIDGELFEIRPAPDRGVHLEHKGPATAENIARLDREIRQRDKAQALADRRLANA